MQYKCRLFSSDIDGDMEAFEELMTRSYENDASVTIVQKETKLTEEGKYLVAVHWVEEEGEGLDSRNIISDMISEGV